MKFDILKFLKIKKKLDDEPPLYTHSLIVTTQAYQHTYSFDWEHKRCNWSDFKKWYFGRPQSEYHMFKFRNGEQLLKRDDIVSFKIKVEKHDGNNTA